MKQLTITRRIMLLMIMITFMASAQEDYVVLTKGDTLYGKVQHLNYGVEQKVQLTDSKKKKTVYSILQARAFRLKGENYHAIRFFSTYKYMKLVESGYASLYLYQEDDKRTWDGRYIYRMDGTGLDVPNIGFKRKITEFLQDCPQLVDTINAGKLARTDMAEIVKRYNTCIEQNTKVSRNESIAVTEKQSATRNAWDELSRAVEANTALEEKESIQEMITEARTKTERGEKIPKFLQDSLKKSFKDYPDLQQLLAKAISTAE